MKKILFILIPLCIIFIACNAQVADNKIKPAGLYGYKKLFGTDGYCPVWYFYNDTGFIYLSALKGIITKTGIGRWSYATDSSVHIYPSPAPELLQPQHIIDYQAEIKYSPDTNYIVGRVLRMDGKPLVAGAGISMIIDGEAMGMVTPKDGKFNFKISRSRKTSGFKAQADVDCEIIKFVLQPNSNYHHLVITLPPKDTLPLTIATQSYELKFIHNLGHIDDPSKINDLKYWLKAAITRQPLHKLYFESLLNKLPQDTGN